MNGIETGDLGPGYLFYQKTRLVEGRLGTHAPVPVDHRREAGVGRTHYRDAVFHRSHRLHEQMQIRSGRAAEPGVIGNVYQKIRSLGDEPASQVWEDTFIAYQHAKLSPGKGEDRRR